jgi:hypothetical protein
LPGFGVAAVIWVGWSWLLTGVGVFGLYLIGRKLVLGWIVGILAQVLWVAYAYVSGQPGFYVSAIAYGLVYAVSLRRWIRQARDAEPSS